MKCCIAIGFACLLAGAVVSSSARAVEMRLDYRAPAGCPLESAFVSEVESRGASFETAASETAASQTAASESGAEPQPERWLSVVIEADSGGFAGSLQLRNAQSASDPRRVHAPTCAEVGQALAVVTAIALQSDAAAAEPARASAPPPAPLPAPMPVPPPHRRGKIQRIAGQDSVSVPAGEVKFDYDLAYTLAAGAQFGLFPNLSLPRFDLTVTRANTLSTPGDHDFLLGGVLGVRWTLFPGAEVSSLGHHTKLFGVKAGFSGCTPFSYDPESLVVKLCSEFAVGAMSMQTRDPAGVKISETTKGIGTVGMWADASYTFASIFHLSVTAGAEAWLTRLSAQSLDGAGLFETEVLSGYLMAGLGVHF